jgi:hypothetical protein
MSSVAMIYLAGLFVAPKLIWSWINQLLWLSNTRLAARPASYRSPSWSWASLDTGAPISHLRFLVPPAHHQRKYDVAFRVPGYGADLSLATAPFGSVKAAHLVVGGFARRVSSDNPVDAAISVTLLEDGPSPLTGIALRQPTRAELFLLPDTTDDSTWISLVLAGDSDSVLLLEMVPATAEHGKTTPILGLALRPADPPISANTFRRAGLFAFFAKNDENGLKLLSTFCDEDVSELKLV